MTDVAEAPAPGRTGLPVWARVGIIAVAVVIVVVVIAVTVRIVTRVPHIPLGVTPVDQLQPGACLAESGSDLREYTVVSCNQEHPQQVFATADLQLDAGVYASAESALATFGDEVCDHYLEYRLFLREGLETFEYVAYAIAVPGPERYAAGDTVALCALAAADGSGITGDAYRPMP